MLGLLEDFPGILHLQYSGRTTILTDFSTHVTVHTQFGKLST